jgi:hypothetical protein
MEKRRSVRAAKRPQLRLTLNARRDGRRVSAGNLGCTAGSFLVPAGVADSPKAISRLVERVAQEGLPSYPG